MRWMLQLKVSTPHEGSANHVHPAGAIQPRPSPMAGEPSRHACNPVVSVHRLPSTRPRSLWRLASPLHFQAAHKTACCISARTVAMHTQQPNILKPETDCVVKGAHHPGSRRGPPDRDCQTSALVEKRRLQTIAPTTTNRVCKATNDIDEHVHCCMQLIIKSSVPSSFFFFVLLSVGAVFCCQVHANSEYNVFHCVYKCCAAEACTQTNLVLHPCHLQAGPTKAFVCSIIFIQKRDSLNRAVYREIT